MMPADPTLKEIYRVQFFVLFRTYLAKIFEANRLLNRCELALKKSNSKVASALISAQRELAEVRRSRFFSLTKHMRDKAINHYDLDSIRHLNSILDERGPLTAFIHQTRGNSNYSYGDALLQYGVADLHFGGNGTVIGDIGHLSEWVNWSVEFSRCFSVALESFIQSLDDHVFRDTRVTKKHHYCEPELTYSLSAPSLPIVSVP
jgi:hypothetical protein